MYRCERIKTKLGGPACQGIEAEKKVDVKIRDRAPVPRYARMCAEDRKVRIIWGQKPSQNVPGKSIHTCVHQRKGNNESLDMQGGRTIRSRKLDLAQFTPIVEVTPIYVSLLPRIFSDHELNVLLTPQSQGIVVRRRH
jgi:hypothetical protein